MSLIATALGGIGGVISGLVPEVMGYFKKKQEIEQSKVEHAQELERRKFDLESEVKLSKLKHAQTYDEKSWDHAIAEDSNYTARLSEVVKANTADLKDAPGWVKAWNAMLRPSFITVNIALFTVAASLQAYVIFSGVKDFTDLNQLQIALNLFWANELISGSISGTVSFLIGYRSARKLPIFSKA